jgi:hypothetical protein
MSQGQPKRRLKPRVLRDEDTEFGKMLKDPKNKAFHDKMVAIFRQDAREEIEALERSERLTRDDYKEVIY